MKRIIAVTVMLGVICVAGVAAGNDKLEDVVQTAKAKVKVEQFLFWYDGEKVHIFSPRAGEDEGSIRT